VTPHDPRVDFRATWSFDQGVLKPTQSSTILGLVLLLLCLPTHNASAEEGEHTLSAGLSWLSLTHPQESAPDLRMGALGGITYRYAVDDFWELGGNLSFGVDAGGDQAAAFVGQALFETRYVIDALTWVPYLCIGAGALMRSGAPRVWKEESTLSVDLSAHAGIGVEWRPARAWSIGIAARYHILITDFAETRGPIDLNVSASWYVD